MASGCFLTSSASPSTGCFPGTCTDEQHHQRLTSTVGLRRDAGRHLTAGQKTFSFPALPVTPSGDTCLSRRSAVAGSPRALRCEQSGVKRDVRTVRTCVSGVGPYLDETTKGAGTSVFLVGGGGALPGRRPRGRLFDQLDQKKENYTTTRAEQQILKPSRTWRTSFFFLAESGMLWLTCLKSSCRASSVYR